MRINLDRPGEDHARIEILPLLDVVFCVLVFFILATLQLKRPQGIEVTLPGASNVRVQQRASLLVTVDASGQPYVEKQPVDVAQLQLLLRGYHQANPQGMMLLYADKGATYQSVVTMLDLMRSVGGDRVALATTDLPPQQTPTTIPGLPPLTTPPTP